MRAVLILIVLCFVTFFAGLGRPALTDSDEAFYAEAGREMLESGDWLTPHFNYQDRFEKPILFYWFVALAYVAGGVSAAVARVPSALAGVGVVLLTFGIASRYYGKRTGFMAGAIAATSFGHFALARMSLPDLPLAFFITLTIWTGLRAIEPEELNRSQLIVLSAAAAALGFLVKGPVAIAVAVLVLGAVMILEGTWRSLRQRDLALAAIVLAVIALPWYAAMTAVHGTGYLSGFFIGDNLERFATTRFNDPRPLWFYVPVLLGGLLPWSPFLLLGVTPLWRRLRGRQRWTPVEWRLVFWALLPLVLFSISIGKQPRYILPVLPPIAVLMARAIDAHVLRGGGALSLRAVTLSAGALIAALGLLLERLRPLVLVDVPAGLITAAVAILVLTGAAVVVAALALRPAALLTTMTAAAAVSLLAVHYGALSSGGPEPVERIAEMVKAHHDGTRPIGHQVFIRNLVFYTGLEQQLLVDDAAVTAFLDDPTPGLCVIHEAVWNRIRHSRQAPARALAEVRYFNTAALRLGTLLDPNPARDLESVVLVTNR